MAKLRKMDVNVSPLATVYVLTAVVDAEAYDAEDVVELEELLSDVVAVELLLELADVVALLEEVALLEVGLVIFKKVAVTPNAIMAMMMNPPIPIPTNLVFLTRLFLFIATHFSQLLFHKWRYVFVLPNR